MSVARFLPVLPQGPGPWADWELRSNTARSISPLVGTTKTLERPGARWAPTFRYQNLNGANRNKVLQFIAQLRGQAGRFYAYDPLHDLRGSFPATELFTNNEFTNGTTGWTAQNGSIKDADLGVRLVAGRAGVNPQARQSISLPAQYAPFALRSIFHDGRGSDGLSAGPFIADGAGGGTSGYTTERGHRVVSVVSRSTSTANQNALTIASTSGFVVGDYMDLSYASLARCMMVDNGPNYCQFSDQLDNAAWTKSNASISANAAQSPDGTTTADEIIEDSASTISHYILQDRTRANAVAQCVSYGWFKQASGDRDITIYAGDTSHYGYATFDLSAGTVGSVSFGGSGSEGRAYITSDSNGWHFCVVVVRVPAGTTIRAEYHLTTNAGVQVYTGDGTSGVYGWRLGSTVSSLPTRGMQTTSAGDTDGTLQTGNGLDVAGLPASTDGLLLPNDWIQVVTPSGTELKRLIASLDSDAAGLGHLRFEPSLRESPVHNAPIIVSKPFGRFILDENSVRWTETADGTSDVEFTAVEDVVA